MILYFSFLNIWKWNFESPSIFGIYTFFHNYWCFFAIENEKGNHTRISLFHFLVYPDVVVAYNQECLEIQATTVECSFVLNTLQYFPSWLQLLPNPSAAAFARKLDFHSFLQFPLLVNGSPENWTQKVYSWSSCKRPPKMSSLCSRLPEVVAYESLDHIGTKCFLVRTC